MEIREVKNGFIAAEEGSFALNNVPEDEIYVFTDIDTLVDWIRDKCSIDQWVKKSLTGKRGR